MPRKHRILPRLALAATLAAYLAWRMWTARAGSKYQPASRRAVRRMLQLAEVKPGETLVDLGSGDGRIVSAAARDHGAHAIGVEIDPLRVWLGRMHAWVAAVGPQVRTIRGDLFDADLTGADVVTVFLSQAANERLEPKLLRELAPGSRVVSYRHTFSRMPLIAEDPRHGVRVYKVPAHAASRAVPSALNGSM